MIAPTPTDELPVLALEAARLAIEPGGAGTRPISLRLARGELTMIEPGDAMHSAEFADSCVGLIEPLAGEVRFLGVDWTKIGADAATLLRGRIGRLVSAGAWLPGLDMVENVLLPQLHHTRRPLIDLRDEAARLARQFGLPGLPAVRPGELAPGELQRAGLVRAFLGRPRLIVLERATEGIYPEILQPLINAIRDLRERGGAVLWLTLDPRVWSDTTIPADARHRLIGGRLTGAATAAS